jgi:hypothetical protein
MKLHIENLSGIKIMPICCGQNMRKKGFTEAGRQRYYCAKCKSRDTRTIEAGNINKLIKKNATKIRSKVKEGVKRFVVTCAQNNTDVDEHFFNALKKYCKYNKAKLIIIATHYKNISLYTASKEYKKYWDLKITPYLTESRIDLGGNIIIRGDVRIACTTLNPLTGKEPIEGNKWTIYGHPQFALEPVACPRNKTPKQMFTTGCITKKNYSNTNLGIRAKFHHVMGALIVEVIGGKSFVRQLNATNDGDFYDLNYHYFPKRSRAKSRIEALAPGDEHIKFNHPKVRKATYDGPKSMIAILNPKYIIRNDVLDGYAGSHHHQYDDVILFNKHHTGDDDYRKELDETVKFINDTTPENCTTLIVDSNHHDFIDKWLNRVDPKKDHRNALLIHELKHKQYTNSLKNKTTKAFLIYIEDKLTCKFKFLDINEPYLIQGISVEQHGHIGTNGSRGSAKGLAKTSVKLMIGHGHGAHIVRGVYQVGVSTYVLDYEKGMSDHGHSHGVIYPNGKRAIYTLIGDQWHG